MEKFFLPGLLIVITVGLNTLAQTLLKLGSGGNLFNIHLLGGVVAYALSTIVYIKVLGNFNLSVAYPSIIGLTILATTFTGAFLLHEKVTTVQWMGIGLMMSGIFAITLNKLS